MTLLIVFSSFFDWIIKRIWYKSTLDTFQPKQKLRRIISYRLIPCTEPVDFNQYLEEAPNIRVTKVCIKLNSFLSCRFFIVDYLNTAQKTSISY